LGTFALGVSRYTCTRLLCVNLLLPRGLLLLFKQENRESLPLPAAMSVIKIKKIFLMAYIFRDVVDVALGNKVVTCF
jgi:hypothetical protein